VAEDWSKHGFLRVGLAAPATTPADPAANARALQGVMHAAADRKAALVLTPELSLTGYSCDDLFASAALLDASERALAELVAASADLPIVAVVGAPWLLPDGRLLNAAVAIGQGRILAVVPKQNLPMSGEFYERRWFVPGSAVVVERPHRRFGTVPVGGGQLLMIGGVGVGIEVCEDLWAPRPPSVELALGGAELLLNLSASNELVGKAAWRRDLVRVHSGRLYAAYVYASAGLGESTRDTVYGGHLIVAEDGEIVAEEAPLAVEPQLLLADLDIERLRHERRRDQTFAAAERGPTLRPVDAGQVPSWHDLGRSVLRRPFVPEDLADRRARVQEILTIQAAALARRLASVGEGPALVGLSGGLDSTLALLVARQAVTRLGRASNSAVLAVTMPGPGTSEHTLTSARRLAEACGVGLREVPISAAVAAHLADLGHPPEARDVTFENAQARERTQILFDLANQVGGMVVGTGDMSELALGWATYNGDHMSGYGVNVGVPKTLVRDMIEAVAEAEGGPLADVLLRIAATPVSPELLPPDEDGAISQVTEALVGPYELHDFFLWHLIRRGSRADRVLALAEHAFAGVYDRPTIARWLRVFLRRFFSQQFKRTTLPPGPKVGSLALSPRADWRMPDEATAAAWLAALDSD
jgi:NAD+ synthase (glutamine-hydrolysing)